MNEIVRDTVRDTVRRLDDKGWEVLLKRIRDGACTPILGTGVYSEGPSLRTRVAKKWSEAYGYPLTDGSDLARVARFLSVEYPDDREYAASQYIEEVKNVQEPDFTDPDDPYTILAKLPLPLYITTNYDYFLEKSLKKQHKEVKTDLCRWIPSIDEPSPLNDGFDPNVANPVVFHLYGYTKSQQSIALSEDDYFQFLINVSKDQDLIPSRVDKAITGTSLILLGYSLDDWDFRVLFHFLAAKLSLTTSKTHVAVQISPLSNDEPEDLRQRAQTFFDKYFESRSPTIRVTWDTTRDFMIKLRDKWEASGYAK